MKKIYKFIIDKDNKIQIEVAHLSPLKALNFNKSQLSEKDCTKLSFNKITIAEFKNAELPIQDNLLNFKDTINNSRTSDAAKFYLKHRYINRYKSNKINTGVFYYCGGKSKIERFR